MLSRRDFLKIAGLGAGGVLLQGCAPQFTSPLSVPSATGSSIPASTATRTPTAAHAATNTASATPSPTNTATNTPPPTRTPDTRLLCFVLWDHQLAKYSYRPRNVKKPVPETVPLRSGGVIRLTKDWIAYWRGILRLCNPKMSQADFEQGWKGLTAETRAFTNHSGPDSGNFAIHSITCGGATHQMVTGIPDRGWMEIYTLNGEKGPPPLPDNVKDIDLTRHFFATSGSNVRLPDGSWAVYGFPQFENCIVPLISPNDTDQIDVSRIKVVDSIQRPYNTWPPPPSPAPPTSTTVPTADLSLFPTPVRADATPVPNIPIEVTLTPR